MSCTREVLWVVDGVAFVPPSGGGQRDPLPNDTYSVTHAVGGDDGACYFFPEPGVCTDTGDPCISDDDCPAGTCDFSPFEADNIVTFDGIPEDTMRIRVITSGGAVPTVTESVVGGPGAGEETLYIDTSSQLNTDLFPGGHQDPTTGVPLEHACFIIGGLDPLDWDSPPAVRNATLEFTQQGANVWGPADITSLFDYPWDGVQGVIVTNMAGLGINDVHLVIVLEKGGAENTGACCIGIPPVCQTTTQSGCEALGGDWHIHEECPDVGGNFECPETRNCPVGSLFSQEYQSGGFAVISDTRHGNIKYDNFTNLGGQICDVHWWGINKYLTPAGEFIDCEKGDTEEFEIKLYLDDDGVPGAEVCSHLVTCSVPGGTKTDTGDTFGDPGPPIYRYDADFTQTECCDYLSTGWISIQGLDIGWNCYFLWHSSLDGDISSYPAADYDMAVCLTGPAWVPDDIDSNLEVDIEIFDWNGSPYSTTLLLNNQGLSDAIVMREPPEYTTGQDIAMEMIALELSGFDATLGPVVVRERADKASSGVVTNVVANPSPGAFESGDSSFSMWAEIEVGGMILYTNEPHTMTANGILALPPKPPDGGNNVYEWAGSGGGPCLGDMNCDGVVDMNDGPPFVLALLDPAEYANQFPGCDINNGDMNGDTFINGLDVGLFVDEVLNPSGCAAGAIQLWVEGNPDPVGQITGVRHILKIDLPNACCYEDADFNWVCVDGGSIPDEAACDIAGPWDPGQWTPNTACGQLDPICGGGACCTGFGCEQAQCAYQGDCPAQTSCEEISGDPNNFWGPDQTPAGEPGYPCDPSPCRAACCLITNVWIDDCIEDQSQEQCAPPGSLNEWRQFEYTCDACRDACCVDDDPCVFGFQQACEDLVGITYEGQRCDQVPDPCERCAEPPQNCHVNDQLGHGAGGIIGVVSDANPAFPNICVDDFRPSATGDITDVCWWGFYGDQLNGFNDCVPEGGPGDFTITYYADDVTTPGLPGAIIGGPFTVTPFVFSTGNLIGGNEELEYTASHGAVAVTADSCYWMAINANTVSSDPDDSRCLWLWETAGPSPGDGKPGNRHSVSGEYPYTVGDMNDWDHPWCLNLPVNFVDCDVMGACCQNGVCAGTVARVSCEDNFTPPGVWIFSEECAPTGDYDCPYCITPSHCQQNSSATSHYSDDDFGIVAYDNFVFSGFGGIAPLTEICWTGMWVLSSDCGNAGDPDAQPLPAWRVVYYADADLDGMPDIASPLAEYSTDIPFPNPGWLTVTQENLGIPWNDAVSNLHRMWAEHDAVPLGNPRACYWVMIAGLEDGCNALWVCSDSSFGGDGKYAQGPADNSFVRPGTDTTGTDQVFCLTNEIRQPATPPCVNPEAACCVNLVCVANTTLQDCSEPPIGPGLWRWGDDCDDVNFVCPKCLVPEYCNSRSFTTSGASDLDDGVVQYDDFVTTESGALNEICWEGLFVKEGCPSQPGAPPPNWEVRYYLDADSDGLPDVGFPIATRSTDIAEPNPGWMTVVQSDTGEAWNSFVTTIHLMEAEHEDVAITAGECYWIEIAQGLDDCSFLWIFSDTEQGGSTNGAFAEGPSDHSSVHPGDSGFKTDPATNPPERWVRDKMFCLNLLLQGGAPSCSLAVAACCLDHSDCEMLSGPDCEAAAGLKLWFAEQVCGAEFDCSPPANDHCADAIRVFDNVGPIPYCTWLADTDLPEYCTTLELSCGPVADIWFRYQATFTGQTCISICTPGGNPEGGYDGHIAVFEGDVATCAALLEVACDDDMCPADDPTGDESALWLNTTIGQWYLISIGECENAPSPETWGCSELVITPNAASCSDAPPP